MNPTIATTVVTSSALTAVYGATITYSSTVSASDGSIPTGTVTLLDGAVSAGTCSLSSGGCTITTSALSGGTHTLVASYPGESAGFLSSSSGPITQQTQGATTSMTLSASPTTVGLQVLQSPTPRIAPSPSAAMRLASVKMSA